jgi:ABC-type polysaccharide/polyol phosphate export permease
VLSTRYRDIPQVIATVIQVVFFLTPIFWSPNALPNRPAFILLNPFYHLIEIVRAPLLGEVPTMTSWVFCIGMAVAGLGFVAWLYRRAHARIAYWSEPDGAYFHRKLDGRIRDFRRQRSLAQE